VIEDVKDELEIKKRELKCVSVSGLQSQS